MTPRYRQRKPGTPLPDDLAGKNKPLLKINTWRRITQYGILAVILLLPLLGWFRLDTMSMGTTFSLTSLKLRFFGHSIWLDEFFMINLGLLWFAAFIGFLSVTLGRVFCGWGCPQTILSELVVNGSKGNATLQALISFGLSFYVAANSLLYFVDLPYLAKSLLAPVSHPVVFWSFWITLAVMFLDLFLYRHAFCNGFCPYGWLQSVLQGDSALVVRYETGENGSCLQCNQCVSCCYMDIDIKDGPLQMSCQKCGKCVDACRDVVQKQGTKKYLRYTVENSQGAKANLLHYRSLTLIVALIGLTSLLGYMIMVREPVHLIVNRDTSYGSHHQGKLQLNAYKLTVIDRDDKNHALDIIVSGIDGARLLKGKRSIKVAAGKRVKQKLFVTIPRKQLKAGSNRIYFTVTDHANVETQRKASFFYERKVKK